MRLLLSPTTLAPRRIVQLVLLVLLTLVLIGVRSRAQPSNQPVPEYSVKAGYLLLFARYVQWPDHAFTAADSPLVIAVVGRDPFGEVLDATLRAQRVGTHGVHLIRVTQPSETTHAHLVYIADRQQDEKLWLAFFRGRPTLTVSESKEALDIGAMVRLAQESDKVRFDVDWTAAVRANLKIASPMLVSAREVRGGPENRGGQQ